MFIGHFAVAFAAKRVAPSVSLGTLFVATELLDVLWPVFVLLGVESVAIQAGITAFTPLDFTSYPWTHSLVMSALWGLAAAALYYLARGNGRAALVVGLIVLSHWVLDALVHRPDLPLVPGGGIKVGLGLWNSIPGTLIVEGALFALGLALYASRARAADRAGRYGLWILVALLLAAYAGAAFGPPPPGVEAVAWAGILGGALTAALGYWVDRHRRMVA